MASTARVKEGATAMVSKGARRGFGLVHSDSAVWHTEAVRKKEACCG